ncbi:MAG: DUF4197 domain-containing protein [Chitinophagaceae bacterium]|nr:DUF4197 domain-containing protein [Chitinophagaceae bacterium]MCB9044910.1 DUF4197 domain-containing protein [Chitinophagales bacterium]
MKKISIFILACCMVATYGCNAQLGGWLNKGKKIINDASNNGGTGALTNDEIIAGLKQALEVGSNNAGKQLSTINGYFGNQIIKILMPPEAKKVENTLRSIGMGAEVDKAIMAMNRAAEDAAAKAAPIFINAIKTMSIQDGLGILKGGNSAATNYLKNRTTQQLTNAFRPVIENSLNKVNATKYWSQVFTIYNRLPTTFNKINPDLTGYVTERALSGLFVTVEQEENKIRQNPSARVTDLLRKVFGA